MGTHIFPEVLLNDISGPDGDSLLLSLKLAVDVLVSNPATVFQNQPSKIVIGNYFGHLAQICLARLPYITH